MRQLIQQNPNLLPPFLQQIRESNPRLLQASFIPFLIPWRKDHAITSVLFFLQVCMCGCLVLYQYCNENKTTLKELPHPISHNSTYTIDLLHTPNKQLYFDIIWQITPLLWFCH